MDKKQSNLTGNDRYEGFCIDMIKNIANLIGFQYEIQLSPSKVYGIQDPETGEWNGLVRELMDNVSKYVFSFSFMHVLLHLLLNWIICVNFTTSSSYIYNYMSE